MAQPDAKVAHGVRGRECLGPHRPVQRRRPFRDHRPRGRGGMSGGEVAGGVLFEKGAVISMGVSIGASTKIVDRATGEVMYGRVPAYSVIVPGTLPAKDGGPSLACAVIVKRVDERTRSKTSINELLRD